MFSSEFVAYFQKTFLQEHFQVAVGKPAISHSHFRDRGKRKKHIYLYLGSIEVSQARTVILIIEMVKLVKHLG